MGDFGVTKSEKPSRKEEEEAVVHLDLKDVKGAHEQPDDAKARMAPRELVEIAAKEGRLTESQRDALLKLCSRMSLLGFETRRSSSVLLTGITSAGDAETRRRLAFELYEYLMGDALAKDIMQSFSSAFELP